MRLQADLVHLLFPFFWLQHFQNMLAPSTYFDKYLIHWWIQFATLKVNGSKACSHDDVWGRSHNSLFFFNVRSVPRCIKQLKLIEHGALNSKWSVKISIYDRPSHHQNPAQFIVIFIRLTVNDNWSGNSRITLVNNIGFCVVNP